MKAIFVVVLGDGIFLTKFRNMAILRLSWRGSGNSARNEVFDFLVHFLEAQKLVEIS